MARSVAWIVVGNLGSKALAVVREVLFAAWFGTGELAAAFRVAQTAYLLPTQALIGDALSAGLLPLYRQLRKENIDAARLLVLVACSYGVLFSLVVTAALYTQAEAVAVFVAPGASDRAQTIASSLIRVMALATPFYVLAGILSYVEAAFGKFGGIAFRPVLLNIGAIAGAGLAVLSGQDRWLAVGLLLSHVAFFGWTLVELRRLDGLLPAVRPLFRQVREIAGRFALNLLPLLGLPLAAQLNVLVERIVSSHLGTQVIPSVDYARFVADTVVQLIAVPLGVLTMSSHGGERQGEEVRAHVDRAVSTILLLAIPLSAFIAVHATSIVRVLFARGAFGADSVEMTSALLAWMGGSLGATVTAYYLVKALNAQMRNREALLAIVLGCAANMLVNLTLWPVFGPHTIGMAVAAYSLVVMGSCVWRMQLLHLTPLVFVLLLQAALVIVLGLLAQKQLSYPWDLVAGALFAALVWVATTLMLPTLRLAASPLFHRLASRLRKSRS